VRGGSQNIGHTRHKKKGGLSKRGVYITALKKSRRFPGGNPGKKKNPPEGAKRKGVKKSTKSI